MVNKYNEELDLGLLLANTSSILKQFLFRIVKGFFIFSFYRDDYVDKIRPWINLIQIVLDCI